MKKIVIVVLAFAFILCGTTVPFAKPKKTGEVNKNVYTDSEFGFQITGLGNWKVKNQKEPSLLRLIMTQKNYKVSSIPGASKYTTSIPAVLILADTTSLSLEEVEQCLLGQGKALDNQDEFMIKLDLISNSECIEVHDVAIDSIPARDYILKQPYKKTGEDPRVRDPIYGSSVIIQDFLAGHVILFKRGNYLYVVQSSCEREFFYPTDSEFQKMMATWEFTE